MKPDDAAALLSGAGSEVFDFERSLDGGKTGANLFTTDDGERWVIKWVEDPPARARRRDGVAVSERLRIDAGWPTPARRCVEVGGWLFVIQRFVRGDTRECFTPAVAEALVAAHHRRLGLAADVAESSFAHHLLLTLRTGADTYCLHEPLRVSGPRGRRFIDDVERIGASIAPTDLPAEDLIHWDLHPGNIIVAPDDTLAGIIDTDHAKPGDARSDLVCLGLTGQLPGTDPAVQDRLRTTALDGLDDMRRAAYVAHYVLRFADWAVRDGSPAEVDHWLDLADDWL